VLKVTVALCRQTGRTYHITPKCTMAKNCSKHYYYKGNSGK